jgi:hypothetical protein
METAGLLAGPEAGAHSSLQDFGGVRAGRADGLPDHGQQGDEQGGRDPPAKISQPREIR